MVTNLSSFFSAGKKNIFIPDFRRFAGIRAGVDAIISDRGGNGRASKSPPYLQRKMDEADGPVQRTLEGGGTSFHEPLLISHSSFFKNNGISA